MRELKNSISTEELEARKKSEIAKFFRDRRIAAGLSEAEFVEAVGLEDLATLMAYESGRRSIPLDEVFGMTNVLNIPPEDIVGLIYDLCRQEGQL